MNTPSSSNPSPARPQIERNSVVRVLYGPHAGQYATVIAVGQCGHPAYDLVTVDLHSSLDERVVHLPCFALELVPPAPVRPSGIARSCRFKVGDLVKSFYGTGRVIEVYNEPVAPDHTGRTSGVFHARYKISVVWKRSGHDSGWDHVFDTRYDYELQPASV